MNFLETPLAGAYIIETRRHEDARGYFARMYCRNEFREIGLLDSFVQSNISFNHKQGTLRGMHYQDDPYAEVKLVTCFAGEIYDVIVDVRRDSETYCSWFGVHLSSSNNKSLYIPKGFAHGFLTMQDDTLVHYQMGEFYKPEYARGIRWNDPAFNIVWPGSIETISERDRTYPDFQV